MFEVALAIGVFAYLIFLFGLLGWVYPAVLIATTCIFWGGFFFLQKKNLFDFFRELRIPQSKLFLLGISYLGIQAAINVVGLFGPEIGFDATWYHLTLPKLYLMYHAVVSIPGGILYYSDMPKLTEMLYTVGLSFGSDFFARGIHFVLGILTLFTLYKLGRKFFSPLWALLLPIIFYSNLVVGWESISGYIDLSRTFFAVVALLAFLQWRETKNTTYFLFSAIFVGLTIGTKLLALPDIGIYAAAVFFFERKSMPIAARLKRSFAFMGIVLVCILPWLSFSFIHTGNPIYPMLSQAYKISGYWEIFNPIFLVSSLWGTFAASSDPINPLFLALLPFGVIYGKTLWREFRLPTFFAITGIFAWYITPQTGGGRYILPYLPVVSLVSVFCITKLSKNWQKVFIGFITVVAIISLVYRAGANAKFLPVIFHKESMASFMTTHLQYNLGDFYDIDGYFAKHIKPTDRVLLYGFHNLYYVDFPFIDSSWAAKGNSFDYVAVQGKGMPQRFVYWTLIYFNPITQVRLYSFKNQVWYY